MKRLLCLLAMTMFGQEFIIKTETRLVIVDLAIKDKSGKPITNLKPGDIDVYEDGVKQNVRVFELQKLSADTLAPVSFAENSNSTVEEKAAPPVVAKAAVS